MWVGSQILSRFRVFLMCSQCSELLLSWYSTSQITKPGPRSRRIYPWGRGGSELPHFTALSPPLNLWNCINQILKSLEQTMLLLKKKKSFFIQVQMLVVEHVSLQKISLLLKIKLFPIISLNEHMYLAFSFITCVGTLKKTTTKMAVLRSFFSWPQPP